MSHNLYRKNDNLVQWTWLANATDGGYINDGTVTMILYSGYALTVTTGALLTPSETVNVLVTGPITLTYVAGSNGIYQGVIPASLDLSQLLEYTLQISATAGGRTARRSIPVTVVDRVT